MSKKDNDQPVFVCPVGRFFHHWERRMEKGSEFRGHLTRSRIEFLKALRSLVDESIQDLEKRSEKASRKRATKIVVE